MKTHIYTLILIASAILLSSCSTTSLVNVWNSPDFEGHTYKKVAIVALLKSENDRRIAETTLVKQFLRNGVEAIAASDVMVMTKETTKEEIEAMLKLQQCDAVLTLRPTGVDKSYNVDNYGYGGNPFFYGYYTGFYANQTVVTTNDTYNVENNFYDANSGKLVWSAGSESFDPSSTATMAEGIGSEILMSLQKQGHLVLTTVK